MQRPPDPRRPRAFWWRGVARLGRWAAHWMAELGAVWHAARDRRVRWTVRALAALVIAYALSPIDLVPDAIPDLGILDDVILVPLGIAAVVALVPAPLMEECRCRSRDTSLPKGSAAIVIASWAGAAGLVALWLYPLPV